MTSVTPAPSASETATTLPSAPASGGAGNGPSGEVGGAANPEVGGAGEPGPAPTGVVDPGAEVIFEDDFESGSVGMGPADWDTFISYQVNPMNPQGDGTGATIGTEQKHGGSQAIHFNGGSSPAMITRALPQGTNKIVVTAWVWMSRQLGNQAAESQNHETLIGIRAKPGDANDEIRFGEIKGAIGVNEVPTDNIMPKLEQWHTGESVAAMTWSCMEIVFAGDQPQHELHAWIDGKELLSITSGDQWQNGNMPADWMKGKFTEVILGWQSFSNNTIDVWMDDVVVSTGRVGCR
ncbi:MAG TPA: hypothetical protein VHM70_18790 [Polyangiaceae bacterium]|jgi:hypothetical protein|nr:hypothetical protein [Polyangiaceae bacterium]